MDYDVEELLSGAEELDVSVSREESGLYRVEAVLEYEGEDIELTLRSLDSPDELGDFYVKYLEDRMENSSPGIYGNSERVERRLEEEGTWGLTSSGEWGVDVYRSLRKNMYGSEESEGGLIDHVSASALAAVSMSESYGMERTEDYGFYLGLVRDLDREPRRGIRGRVKDRAKNRVKKEAADAAVLAKEEVEKEWRRMKREGEIEQARRKAREMAKQKAAETARNIWTNARQSARNSVRSKAVEAREYVRNKGKEFAGEEASEEKEGPEPVLKLERNGVTIYEYGDISGDRRDEWEE